MSYFCRKCGIGMLGASTCHWCGSAGHPVVIREKAVQEPEYGLLFVTAPSLPITLTNGQSIKIDTRIHTDEIEGTFRGSSTWEARGNGYSLAVWARHIDVRAAMAGMANVMACVATALDRRARVMFWMESAARDGCINWEDAFYPVERRLVRETGQREWSAEVRRKVAALKPVGPVIRCQQEDE